MRMSQLRRAAVLTLTLGALATTSACFGSFQLTRKVWTFNKDVSKNKFAQEAVFLVFNIVPVYGVAGFVDAIVINTVEFWTGTNPMTASRTRLDDGTVVQRLVYEKDGARVMSIKAFKADSLVSATTMSEVPGTDRTAFKTVLAGGRTVTRVIGTDASGHAFLVSNSDTSK